MGIALFNCALNGIQALLIIGYHHITTPALTACMEADIPVHFANRQGYYQGVNWSAKAASFGHQLWLRQIQLANSERAALGIAKSLVNARILQQAELLRQRGLGEQAQFNDLLNKALNADSTASLYGIEGAAAKAFFAALKQHIPEEWQFNGRNRRPPRDPFNVLLSIGYTLLYAHSETYVRVAGLLPWQGFYHQSRGQHAALASDLMEPFRHQVERVALNQISLKQIAAKDFSYADNGACLISKAAKKRYLSALLKRFYQERKDGEILCEKMHKQCQGLNAWISGGRAFSAIGSRISAPTNS